MYIQYIIYIYYSLLFHICRSVSQYLHPYNLGQCQPQSNPLVFFLIGWYHFSGTIIILLYPLVNFHIDPGSHRGWKTSETIKNW